MRAGGLPPATRGAEDGRGPLGGQRSMRAGGLPPATRRRAGDEELGLIDRSMRAGGLPPATPSCRRTARGRPWTFNEGRGVTPGDAPALEIEAGTLPVLRSMRAGGLPPATPGTTRRGRGPRTGPFNEGRGVTPGDAPPPRRRPPHTGRSMRAGGLPPATHRGWGVGVCHAPTRSMRAGGLPPATPSGSGSGGAGRSVQ